MIKELKALIQRNRGAREGQTVSVMIEIYCRAKHAPGAALCHECNQLQTYALERLLRCPLKNDKPVCADCSIHCYAPAMREKIKQIMRYSGPRMILRHPVLALMHLIDGM